MGSGLTDKGLKRYSWRSGRDLYCYRQPVLIKMSQFQSVASGGTPEGRLLCKVLRRVRDDRDLKAVVKASTSSEEKLIPDGKRSSEELAGKPNAGFKPKVDTVALVNRDAKASPKGVCRLIQYIREHIRIVSDLDPGLIDPHSAYNAVLHMMANYAAEGNSRENLIFDSRQMKEIEGALASFDSGAICAYALCTRVRWRLLRHFCNFYRVKSRAVLEPKGRLDSESKFAFRVANEGSCEIYTVYDRFDKRPKSVPLPEEKKAELARGGETSTQAHPVVEPVVDWEEDSKKPSEAEGKLGEVVVGSKPTAAGLKAIFDSIPATKSCLVLEEKDRVVDEINGIADAEAQIIADLRSDMDEVAPLGNEVPSFFVPVRAREVAIRADVDEVGDIPKFNKDSATQMTGYYMHLNNVRRIFSQKIGYRGSPPKLMRYDLPGRFSRVEVEVRSLPGVHELANVNSWYDDLFDRIKYNVGGFFSNSDINCILGLDRNGDAESFNLDVRPPHMLGEMKYLRDIRFMEVQSQRALFGGLLGVRLRRVVIAYDFVTVSIAVFKCMDANVTDLDGRIKTALKSIHVVNCDLYTDAYLDNYSAAFHILSFLIGRRNTSCQDIVEFGESSHVVPRSKFYEAFFYPLSGVSYVLGNLSPTWLTNLTLPDVKSTNLNPFQIAADVCVSVIGTMKSFCLSYPMSSLAFVYILYLSRTRVVRSLRLPLELFTSVQQLHGHVITTLSLLLKGLLRGLRLSEQYLAGVFSRLYMTLQSRLSTTLPVLPAANVATFPTLNPGLRAPVIRPLGRMSSAGFFEMPNLENMTLRRPNFVAARASRSWSHILVTSMRGLSMLGLTFLKFLQGPILNMWRRSYSVLIRLSRRFLSESVRNSLWNAYMLRVLIMRRLITVPSNRIFLVKFFLLSNLIYIALSYSNNMTL